MADNVGYTPGVGATVAADEIDGALHQRVKISIGTDGNARDVSETDPMPITVGNDLWLLISKIASYLDSPRGFDKSQQRQRGTVVVESGSIGVSGNLSTVGTVSTVTSVTNIVDQTSIGSIQARIGQLSLNNSAWASCVRARIS